MRNKRSIIAGGMFGAAALAWWGCSRTPVTEIVVGVESQMRVPQDLRTVRLIVNGGGPINVVDQTFPVYNGVVLLPQTLALLPGANQPAVSITVLGYTLDSSDIYFSTEPPITDPEVRVLRRTTTQYVGSQIVYLPLPLRYSCYQMTDCPDGQTCQGGVCTNDGVDAAALPAYADDLVFGNASTCFSPSQCFAAPLPPLLLDNANCIFAIPGTASAPDAGPSPPTTGTGLNVRVRYENFEQEVLDLDPAEGFSIPDMAQPQRFQLPAGLCNELHATLDPSKPNTRKIIALGVSPLFPPKAIYQPICTGDFLSTELPDGAPPPAYTYEPLIPSPSALYVLMDQSMSMQGAYNELAAHDVLSLSFNDPVFSQVSVSFAFFPSANGCPPGGTLMPLVTNDAPSQVASMIGMMLGTHALVSSPLGADTAIALAASGLTDPTKRRAIVMITNNDVTTGTCSVPATAPGGISLYVVIPTGGPATAATNDATLVSGTGQLYNEATDPLFAAHALNQITADLAACQYGAPMVTSDIQAVTYLDPTTLEQVLIPPAPGDCSTSSGFALDTMGHLNICGAACATLKTTITNRSLLSESLNQSPLDLPVFAQHAPSVADQ